MESIEEIKFNNYLLKCRNNLFQIETYIVNLIKSKNNPLILNWAKLITIIINNIYISLNNKIELYYKLKQLIPIINTDYNNNGLIQVLLNNQDFKLIKIIIEIKGINADIIFQHIRDKGINNIGYINWILSEFNLTPNKFWIMVSRNYFTPALVLDIVKTNNIPIDYQNSMVNRIIYYLYRKESFPRIAELFKLLIDNNKIPVNYARKLLYSYSNNDIVSKLLLNFIMKNIDYNSKFDKWFIQRVVEKKKLDQLELLYNHKLRELELEFILKKVIKNNWREGALVIFNIIANTGSYSVREKYFIKLYLIKLFHEKTESNFEILRFFKNKFMEIFIEVYNSRQLFKKLYPELIPDN